MFDTFFIISQVSLLLAFLVSDSLEFMYAQEGRSRFSVRAVLFSMLLHVINMSILIGAIVWFRNGVLPEWIKPYFLISYLSNILNIVMFWYHSGCKGAERQSVIHSIVQGLIGVNAAMAFGKIGGLF